MFFQVGEEKISVRMTPDFFDGEIEHGSYEIKRTVTINGRYSLNISLPGKEMSKEIAIKGAIMYVAGKIADEGLTSKAFSTLDFDSIPEEEWNLPLCEDDCISGETNDIRSIAEHDDVCHRGMDFNHIVRFFLEDNMNDEIIELAMSS